MALFLAEWDNSLFFRLSPTPLQNPSISSPGSVADSEKLTGGQKGEGEEKKSPLSGFIQSYVLVHCFHTEISNLMYSTSSSSKPYKTKKHTIAANGNLQDLSVSCLSK